MCPLTTHQPPKNLAASSYNWLIAAIFAIIIPLCLSVRGLRGSSRVEGQSSWKREIKIACQVSRVPHWPPFFFVFFRPSENLRWSCLLPEERPPLLVLADTPSPTAARGLFVSLSAFTLAQSFSARGGRRRERGHATRK